MSQQDVTNKVAFVGDGVDNSPYSWPHPLNSTADLKMLYMVDATGVETAKALTTDFTIAIDADGGGAAITLVTGAPATGTSLVLYLDTEITQSSTYARHNSIEGDLDKQTQINLSQQEQIDRCLKLPPGDGQESGGSASTVQLPSLIGATASDQVTVKSDLSGFELSSGGTIVSAPVEFSTDNKLVRTDAENPSRDIQDSGIGVDDSDNLSDVGTVNTHTIPGGTDTFAMIAASQTLTNKTLTTPIINGLGADLTVGSHTITLNKGADVASATALPLITDGNFFDVTGTTTITSMASMGVGTQILLQFDGALILTHHATNLKLPGGGNLTTAAGDMGMFVEYASGDWQLLGWTPAASTGGGDVTSAAAITDHAVVRGADGAKGVQDSGVLIDDSDNVTGMGTLNTHTIPAGTDTLVGKATTDVLTNKTFDANGTGNSLSNVDLSADVAGNLPVTNLNSGTSASGTTFWRGDGTWVTPAGGTSGSSWLDRLIPNANLSTGSSGPAAIVKRQYNANFIDYFVMEYAGTGSVSLFAHGTIELPEDYDGSSLTFDMYFTMDGTDGNDIRMGVWGAALASGDDLASTTQTIVDATITPPAAADTVGIARFVLTPDGAADAAGQILGVTVRRQPQHVDDTNSDKVHVIMVKVFPTIGW